MIHREEIEIPARPAAGTGQPGGINVVRSFFKGSHPHRAPAIRRTQSYTDECLARRLMSGSNKNLAHRSILEGINPVPRTFGTCESSGRLLYRPLWKKGQHSDCYQGNQGRQPNAAKTQDQFREGRRIARDNTVVVRTLLDVTGEDVHRKCLTADNQDI